LKISELQEQLEQEERFLKNWNDWSVVELRIAAALQQVIAYDAVLLEDGTGEREFSGWHVDCEFNRQGELGDRTTKRVSPSAPFLPESRPRQGSADVTPDIIIHRRRSSSNLVAIEVKPSTSRDLEKDRVKLRQYLCEPHLKYAFAVLVTYRDGEATFDPLERITV
jgi:hypothetical protein